MIVLESLPVALFCMAMVFVVLAILFFLIKLFSLGVGTIESAGSQRKNSPVSDEISDGEREFSSGALKLYNTDERTAAMIMAIVSDESGIPLSKLCFKSIKLIEGERT